jgi:tryptophanyl-tRNA synthetase
MSLVEVGNQIKPVILSGVASSGKLTLGNLAGALKNWVKLQDQYNCYYMVADLHAITVRQVPAELRQSTIDVLAMFIAVGIDIEKSTLFVQSHVPEHAELTWVLNSITGMGECSRMTQFKDKSAKGTESSNVSLFDYPVLMAADILLYQANLVPVGDDQKQHLELTRNLATRFNSTYSPTFVIPEPYIPEVGARIMSLQEPTKKMSKSDDNQNSTIFLTDKDEDIKRKIRRAVTDSGTEVTFSKDKPGISNLITLYSIAKNKTIKEVVEEFNGLTYGDFKPAVADAVADYIAPIRNKFEEIRKDKKHLNEIMKIGAEKARATARKTLRKVYKKVGFLELEG